MHLKPKNLALALASAALLTLAGCGGGSGTTSAALDAPVTPAPTTAVPITVIDGAIGNAKVCVDTNANGQCDTGETFAMTKADGLVVLNVPAADVGKYPIVAVVGTDAVDADHGPVKTPFTMQAPADKSAVVSPLTTLVQTLIATTGATSAQAEASVKAQTGLNISLFEDFTKSTTTDSKIAGTVARMVVVTTQQQSTALAAALDKTAIDGTVVTQADLNKLIQNKLLEILPALVTALADPRVRDATTPAPTEAALLAQANALVASPATGLTSSAAATLVAVNNQTATASTVAETPAAGGNLRQLNFSNASNWSSRINVQTAAQATPDSSGFTRLVQRRYSSNSGNLAAWTSIGGSPHRQADLHFNGSSWAGCALNSEDKNTARDAQGNATYNTCDNFETGKTNRASFDVAGRSMLEVYDQIRAAGYSNITISNASTVLGTTTFPANSKVLYQSTSSFANAPAYYPGTGNYVTQYSAAVSAGGTAASQPALTGCNSTEFAAGSTGTNSTTLESLVTAMTGTPCVFAQGKFVYPSASGTTYTSPDLTDEAWGNSTLGIGTVGTAPVGSGTAPGFYSGNTVYRLAFKGTGTNPVTYYACKQRFNNGSARNCTPIGTGNYAITTKGDARVMTLSNPPTAASSLGYQRVFVERGGKIYLGYQNNTGTFNSARLNLPATNALFAQIGLPAVDVNTPLALTRTSYAGDWELFDTVATNASTIFSLFSNGTTSCRAYENGVLGRSFPCVLAFSNLTTGSFTLTDNDGLSDNTATGVFNFLTGIANGSYTETSPPAQGSFAGARR